MKWIHPYRCTHTHCIINILERQKSVILHFFRDFSPRHSTWLGYPLKFYPLPFWTPLYEYMTINLLESVSNITSNNFIENTLNSFTYIKYRAVTVINICLTNVTYILRWENSIEPVYVNLTLIIRNTLTDICFKQNLLLIYITGFALAFNGFASKGKKLPITLLCCVAWQLHYL